MGDTFEIILGLVFLGVCFAATMRLAKLTLGEIFSAADRSTERNQFFMSDYLVLFAEFGLIYTAAEFVWRGHPAFKILLLCSLALTVVGWYVSVRIIHRARIRQQFPRACAVLLFPIQSLLALYFGCLWLSPIIALPVTPLYSARWLLVLVVFYYASRAFSRWSVSKADVMPPAAAATE